MVAASSYDLTPKMGQYMDPVLLLMIMTGLKDKKVYPQEKIVPEIVALLDDYTQLIPLLQDYTGEDKSDRLRMVGDRTDALTKQLAPLLKVLENAQGEMTEFKQCTTFAQMSEKFNVTRDMMDPMYQWICECYSVGGYQRAIDGLSIYQDVLLNVMHEDLQKLIPGEEAFLRESAKLVERRLNVKWGLLAAYIADLKLPEAAVQALAIDSFLEDETEKGTMSKKVLLHQRTHLIHWNLFILFKGNVSEQPISKILDLVMSEKYLALISLQCPHMLRYVGALFLMHKKLKSMTKDLVHVLSQDREHYNDPITEFILALHHDMNFETAKMKLKEATALAQSDYFLWDNVDQIVSNARLAIFSIYCRIHQSVDISTIAEKMDMSVDDAEDWVVDLIQTGKLSGACITSDSSGKSMVSFEKDDPEVYQQVLDKTKNMSLRLFLLQANAHQIAGISKTENFEITDYAPQIAKHLEL